MSASIDLPTQPAIPFDVEILANPEQKQLRELALEHTPFCTKTALGNINKVARNKARMAKFTYIIDRKGDASAYSHNTIEPAKAEALIEKQTEYIKSKGKLIRIDAYVGVGPRALPVQWLYTLEAANIAGMQQVLSFPRSAVETPEKQAEEFQPAFRLVYTPDHHPDMPGGQAIIVDLDNYVTYIMGPDYFGESKKGALRMSAALIYRNGGLLMHSGAKAVHTKDGGALTMSILGLSGTGKTTTTFSKQGEMVEPIQDDMIAIWNNGEISITENGCFAKTEGLKEANEPVIYRGTVHETAWLENVHIDDAGQPDFFKAVLSADDVKRLRDVLIGTGAPEANVDKYISGEVTSADVVEGGIPQDGWDFVVWSQNGRSIIPMSAIENAADLHNVPNMHSLGILNRDEGSDAATPGIVRFSDPHQAAAYFMLGETSKTSAAGKDRGRTRSPFTQPFFPLSHSLQAKRFSELARSFGETTMWLMNTGYIGGSTKEVEAGEAHKVKIRHSSAMLEALIGGKIVWTKDPDFGYEVVDVDAPENQELVSKVPVELLQPRRFFEAKGRMDEYETWVTQMKSEREAFLRKHDVEDAIVSAISLS
ncbi:MAG: phosphoenolpyruvate carboxykinase (ATP) [Nannocystales bacterium]